MGNKNKKKIKNKPKIIFHCFGKVWRYYKLLNPQSMRFSQVIRFQNYNLILNEDDRFISKSKSVFGFIYFIEDTISSINKFNLMRIVDYDSEKDIKRQILIVFLMNDKKIIENLKMKINDIMKYNDKNEYIFIEEKFENEKSDLFKFLENLNIK